MAGQPKSLREVSNGLSILLLLFGGCGTLQVPAIDPTGERIFLPQPSYTTIESPLAGLHGRRAFPRPAFSEPPAIPPCPPCPPDVIVAPTVPVTPAVPVPVPPIGTGIPIGQDRLVLSPARIVAPVNSEVILLAGICGPDGYFVTGQPIEWSLAQESVGQIVDVGETRRRGFHTLSSHSPRKLSNDFALTRTSRAARLITRGTLAPNDDVWLKKGQAWISLTSASQGISHVTAVATGAENWEQRRQVARVHWVDAQWELPPPTVVRAGTQTTLTTKVTRSSSNRPVTDWTVRYELAGGSPATFGTTGQTFLEQPTDANGEATVTITPARIESGSTQVLIRILSPADGDAPVEIGQGWTTITWSAPGLTVNTTGPEVATPDATLVYRVEVSNTGDLPADDVRVSTTIPLTLDFLNSDPPASPFGAQVQWQLGTISPGGAQQIAFRCRAKSAGEVRVRVRATSGNLVAEDAVRTLVETAALEVRVLDPPRTAQVGQRVTFEVQVSNIGSQSLKNVVLRDTFEEALEHSEGEASPIVFGVGDLEQGQSVTKAVSFIVRRPGRHCHTVEAFAEGGYEASAEVCLTAEEANLSIRLDTIAPPRAIEGETIVFEARATNTGDAPLNRIQLVHSPGRSFEAIQATDDHVNRGDGLLWEINTLQPGEVMSRSVECRCLAANSAAQYRTEVATAEGLRDEQLTTIVIERGAPRQPAPPSAAVPGTPPIQQGPRTGRLRIFVDSINNPVPVGENTTYIIEIQNDRDMAVRDVVVEFLLPPALDTQSPTVIPIGVPTGLNFYEVGDGRYEIEPIAEMRPGETREIRVRVVAAQPGLHTFQARITRPVTEEASDQTRVMP